MIVNQVIRDLVISHHKNGKTPKQIKDMILDKASLRTIQRWIAEFIKDGKTKPNHSSGRPLSLTLNQRIMITRKLREKRPLRKISRQTKIPRTTLRRLVKKYNLKAYVVRKAPAMTINHALKRLRFCRWWRKEGKSFYKKFPFLFSDEKVFTVDGGLNKQNQRIYALSREDADEKQLDERWKYPVKVMIWSGLTINGATAPYVVDGMMNELSYTRRILPHAKREAYRLLMTNKFVFQQDGAPSHTSHLSQEWCKRNLIYFLDKFHWPPNSPDLNPLDYYYWDAVVTRMNRNIHYDRESLINEINRAMQLVPVIDVRNAVDSFSKRVRRVEMHRGRYIHKFRKKKSEKIYD